MVDVADCLQVVLMACRGVVCHLGNTTVDRARNDSQREGAPGPHGKPRGGLTPTPCIFSNHRVLHLAMYLARQDHRGIGAPGRHAGAQQRAPGHPNGGGGGMCGGRAGAQQCS